MGNTTTTTSDVSVTLLGSAMKETVKHKLSESIEALVMNISCTDLHYEEPRRKRAKRHLTSRLKRLLNIKKTCTSSKKSLAGNIPSLSLCFVREVKREGNGNTNLTHSQTVSRNAASAACLKAAGVDLPASYVDCSTDLSMGKCQANVPMPLMVNSSVCSPRYTSDDYLAMDCEFVGVGPRKTSALGRLLGTISLVWD